MRFAVESLRPFCSRLLWPFGSFQPEPSAPRRSYESIHSCFISANLCDRFCESTLSLPPSYSGQSTPHLLACISLRLT